MPHFMIRERPLPGEVSLELTQCGTLASIHPPLSARSSLSLREMKLSTALLVASALARELGTDVVIVDGLNAAAG